MASSKLPALQFYPGDWKRDACVQALDYEHRGVWFEILLLMHDSVDRGKLVLTSGEPMPIAALARILGIDEAHTKQILSTIETYGVASRDPDTGALINRRMVRDEALRQAKVEAGRKGGLKSRPPKPPTLDVPKTETGESRTEANGGSSVSVSSSVSQKQHGLTPREEAIADEVNETAGDEPAGVEIPDSETLGFSELMALAKRECHLGLETEDIGNSRSILKGWLGTGRDAQNIEAAIYGARLMVDAGQVDWLKPRKPFSLRALNGKKSVTADGVRDLYAVAQDAYRNPKPRGDRPFGNIKYEVGRELAVATAPETR